MPDEVFIDSSDPDSGVYRALIEQTRRSDTPPESNSEAQSESEKPEELTVADSIPPPFVDTTDPLRSLRPTPLPVIQLDESGLEADVLDALNSLGPFDDQVTAGLNDADEPAQVAIVISENQLVWPDNPELNPRALEALEEFERAEILDELRRIHILLLEAEFLPLPILRNIKKLLLDKTWVADEAQLRETIMIIMNSLDPHFGVKIRGRTNDLDILIGMFLERLEFRDLHSIAIKLRNNLPLQQK